MSQQKQEEIKAICPMKQGYALPCEKHCAWFDEYNQCCAVYSISKYLGYISLNIRRPEKRFDK